MSGKAVSVRLSEDQVVALETVARFDGVALAEEIREGVELLLEARRNDPEFRKRVRVAFEQAREILSGGDGTEEVIEVLQKPIGVEEDLPVEAPATVSAGRR